MTIGLTDDIGPLGDFPSLRDGYLKGGFRVVADITERNDIKTLRRSEGMWAYVISNSTTYKLVGGTDNADWQEVSFGGGGTGIGLVSNLTELAITTPSSDGYLSYVETLKSYFFFDGYSTGFVSDNISVIDTGDGYWVRILSITHPHWKNKDTWYVSGSGNDENEGDIGNPIQTMDEIFRRIDYRVEASALSINLVGSFIFNSAVKIQLTTNNNSTLAIIGELSTIGGGTVQTYTVQDKDNNIPANLDTTGGITPFDFSGTTDDRRILYTTGGATGFSTYIVKPDGYAAFVLDTGFFPSTDDEFIVQENLTRFESGLNISYNGLVSFTNVYIAQTINANIQAKINIYDCILRNITVGNRVYILINFSVILSTLLSNIATYIDVQQCGISGYCIIENGVRGTRFFNTIFYGVSQLSNRGVLSFIKTSCDLGNVGIFDANSNGALLATINSEIYNNGTLWGDNNTNALMVRKNSTFYYKTTLQLVIDASNDQVFLAGSNDHMTDIKVEAGNPLPVTQTLSSWSDLDSTFSGTVVDYTDGSRIIKSTDDLN